MRARSEFEEVLRSQASNIVVVAARGTGKSVAASQFVVRSLLSGNANDYAVVLSSSLRQIKNTLGAGINMVLSDFPDDFYSFNASDFTYSLKVKKNDVRKIYLLSYDMDEKKLRGYHPKVLVLDECAAMPYNLFGSVIEPMKTKETRFLAIGTAQGKNRFYELWQRGRSQEFPDWESYTIRASDSSVFDVNFLKAQRNSLTQAEYNQEYECDFSANIHFGAVYSDFIRKFTEKNNCIDDSYAWDPARPVYTAWDLGFSDYTAIWFFQVRNDVVTFIDYYEDNGREIGHYAKVLLEMPYMYKVAVLPHDGGARNLRGKPIFEQLNAYGIRTEVLRQTSEQEGINVARALLQTCRFNATKCLVGINHIKSFKYKIDKKTGMKLSQTEHDEHSHCADAFRYAAVAKPIYKNVKSAKHTYSSTIGMDYNVF